HHKSECTLSAPLNRRPHALVRRLMRSLGRIVSSTDDSLSLGNTTPHGHQRQPLLSVRHLLPLRAPLQTSFSAVCCLLIFFRDCFIYFRKLCDYILYIHTLVLI